MTGLKMTPGQARTTAQQLAATGQHLRRQWRTATSAIAAGESGIGSDVLGMAFRRIYAAQSEPVRAQARRLGDAIHADGGAGVRCADAYAATDTASRNAVAGAN